MRIFLIGFMGSGKTHWGRQLSDRLKMPFFDLDEVIIEDEKRSVTDIFDEHGEEYFRIKEKQVLETLVDDHQSVIISCGGGTPCFFNNIEYMKKYGLVVWLNTNVDVLGDRLLKQRSHRPVLSGLKDEELRSFIIKKMNERRMYYEQADVIIDNENDMSVSEFAQKILHA
ncbi:MAG: shikimate kinase [Sphingobacteriales bacterium]|nr:MAG: shikimate kinase [Sphingobacteriales bacterium]